MLANSSQGKYCAFCRHWYDPANKALTPRQGRNLYDINQNMTAKCNKQLINTRAMATCPKFQSKF